MGYTEICGETSIGFDPPPLTEQKNPLFILEDARQHHGLSGADLRRWCKSHRPTIRATSQAIVTIK